MRLLRSLLFAPANRLDLLRKFPRLHADAYVIDLEDGTPAGERERARGSLSEIIAELRAARLAAALFVRVNAARSADAARDFAAALDLPIDGIVVPKLAERADVRAAEAAIARAEDRTGRRLGAIALIETAIGVTNVDRLAAYWRSRLDSARLRRRGLRHRHRRPP